MGLSRYVTKKHFFDNLLLFYTDNVARIVNLM